MPLFTGRQALFVHPLLMEHSWALLSGHSKEKGFFTENFTVTELIHNKCEGNRPAEFFQVMTACKTWHQGKHDKTCSLWEPHRSFSPHTTMLLKVHNMF